MISWIYFSYHLALIVLPFLFEIPLFTSYNFRTHLLTLFNKQARFHSFYFANDYKVDLNDDPGFWVVLLALLVLLILILFF